MKIEATIKVTGAICGKIWWPQGAVCGKGFSETISHNQQCFNKKWDKGDTLRDCLLSILTNMGGDFQNAQFTTDSEVEFTANVVTRKGARTVLSRVYAIGELPGCGDLADSEYFASDFNS